MDKGTIGVISELQKEIKGMGSLIYNAWKKREYIIKRIIEEKQDDNNDNGEQAYTNKHSGFQILPRFCVMAQNLKE
jgi:hypothetical protein